MRKLKFLIACEFSGVVREAFNSYSGVWATSCDLIPPEDGRVDFHYQGNVLDILNEGWDGMIFFAPCTFLCNSGVRWLEKGKNVERMEEMRKAAKFFNTLLSADIPLIAGENPIQHKYARSLIRKYDQIVQPYMFGHMETKQTCLWLKGFPPLHETNNVKEEMMKLSKKERERVHYESPSDTRWMERSRTLPGIAGAMADQWIRFARNYYDL